MRKDYKEFEGDYFQGNVEELLTGIFEQNYGKHIDRVILVDKDIPVEESLVSEYPSDLGHSLKYNQLKTCKVDLYGFEEVSGEGCLVVYIK